MRKYIKKKIRALKKIKFKKTIVVFCIGFIVLYTIVQLYMSCKLGIEVSPTLTTCVYAFFGTELATVAVVSIFEKEDNK